MALTRRSLRALPGAIALLGLVDASAGPASGPTGTAPAASAVYTADCAGHSPCLALDSLNLTPQPNAAAARPATAACLRTGASPTCMQLTVPPATDGKPARITASLLPLLESQLALETSNAVAGGDLSELARGARAQPAHFTAEVSFDKAGETQSLPVAIDLGELWKRHELVMTIVRARCVTPTCEIGSVLSVDVRGLDAWMAATKKDASKLTLGLDGIRIPGLQVSMADAVAPRKPGQAAPLRDADERLNFVLSRDLAKSDSANAWTQLLQRFQNNATDPPGIEVGLFDDQGRVAVAAPAAANAPASSAAGSQVVLDPGRKPMFVLIVLAGTAALLLLLQRRDRLSAIRDDAPDPFLADKAPFSLGRSQMLLWTITVVASWIFCILTIGDWTGPNATALILMGISGATALGAVMAGDPPVLDAQAQAALTEYEQALADPPTPAPGKTVGQTIRDAQQVLRGKSLLSVGFFVDITSPVGSDKSALHRLQALAFTAMIWTYYVSKVYQTRAMPDLTDAQLALLGISGGTYVGFKYATKP